MTSMPMQASAGTRNEAVYLKQKGSGTCTLCSAAMLVRNTAWRNGSSTWNKITESSIRSSAWVEGQGLSWSFSYAGIQVSHGTLPGGSANKGRVSSLLKQHPEGIVLYDKSVPHAVFLTDYTDGTFYCADPATGIASGRIALSRAYGVKLNRSTAYWYVSSGSHPVNNSTSPKQTSLKKTFTKGKLKYQLLNKTGEVQVVGSTSTSVTTLTIPATVTKNGQTYRVTRIYKNAFRKCSSLNTLKIGKNVSIIGSKICYGLRNLSKVYIQGTKLKKLGQGAFSSIHESAVIQIPDTKMESYTNLIWNSGIGGTVRVVQKQQISTKVAGIEG